MKNERLQRVIWGVTLILLGLVFLAYQAFPARFSGVAWPWLLVALGGVFVVIALLTRAGGAMIPGAILVGLGGLFLYFTRYDAWGNWYWWMLMPAFVGLGLLLAGRIDPQMRPARTGGFILLAMGLILLAVFGGVFGLNANVLRFWPVLLILLGLLIFVRAWRAEHK